MIDKVQIRTNNADNKIFSKIKNCSQYLNIRKNSHMQTRVQLIINTVIHICSKVTYTRL